MTDHTSQPNKNKSRRYLVKTLLMSGAATAAHTLPQNWTAPVIKNVITPAHAITSGCEIVQCSSAGAGWNSSEIDLGYCIMVLVPIIEILNEPECIVLFNDVEVPLEYQDSNGGSGYIIDENAYVCCASYINIPRPSEAVTVSVRATGSNGSTCEYVLGTIPSASESPDDSGPFSACQNN